MLPCHAVPTQLHRLDMHMRQHYADAKTSRAKTRNRAQTLRHLVVEGAVGVDALGADDEGNPRRAAHRRRLQLLARVLWLRHLVIKRQTTGWANVSNSRTAHRGRLQLLARVLRLRHLTMATAEM